MYRDKRFRLLMDTIPALIWCADAQGRLVFFNKAWLDFTGRSLAQEQCAGWLDDLHPDDAARTEAAIADHLRRREPFRLEFRLRRRDGAWRWMLCTGAPGTDAACKDEGYVGSSIDLTDLKEAGAQRQRDVDEKAAVMQELHHRVKNNAQVFASLLSVQASRAADPAVKSALRVAASRASTMAFAQQQIWDAGSSARFDLGALVRRLARAQQGRGIDIVVDAPATVFVPLATAVPLGLIVHELLTNALFHGYPGGGPGIVRIAVERDREECLLLEVADDGVGATGIDGIGGGKSAGLTIVHSLVRQLGATLEIAVRHGTKVLLRLPCPAPS